MLLILDERLLTAVLFEMNNKSLDFYEHATKNRDLNNYLLILSFFTKIMLNENCEGLYSCSSTRIKIIFIMCFIINDDKLIINLLPRLIILFNYFYNTCDDFEFEKNSSLEFKLKSF